MKIYKSVLCVILCALLLYSPVAAAHGNHAVIEAGYTASLAIQPDGSLWAWGLIHDATEQPGSDAVGFWQTPVRLLEDVVSVSAGSHAMAIKSDGSLWAWGENHAGQLGDGTVTGRRVPVQVMEDVAAVSVSKIGHFTIALQNDGSVWTWGNNFTGQLGNGRSGTTEPNPHPVKVLDDAVAISAGGSFSLAIRSDGTLWGWGGLPLAQGPDVDPRVPAMIMEDVFAVSAGTGHALIIRPDGGVWAFGLDNLATGALGDGHTERRGEPVRVAGIDDAVAVSAGSSHSMAILGDGSLWAWGNNFQGRLGFESAFYAPFENARSYPNPEPVFIMDDVIAVSAGNGDTLAVRGDGSLWAWGARMFDQGIPVSSRVPAIVMDSVMIPARPERPDAPPPEEPQESYEPQEPPEEPQTDVPQASPFADLGAPITLEEAQRTPGLYVKYGDMFIFAGGQQPLTLLDGGTSNWKVKLYPADFQIPRIPNDAQAVIIGIQDIAIYQTFYDGWTIPFSVAIGVHPEVTTFPARAEMRVSRLNNYVRAAASVSPRYFEYLNGGDPQDYTERMLYSSGFNGVLNANRDEQFAFGWWEGTNFIERTYAANMRFFATPSTYSWSREATPADFEIVRTRNGYFEVNFLTPPVGFYGTGTSMRHLRNVVEFVPPGQAGESQPESQPAAASAHELTVTVNDVVVPLETPPVSAGLVFLPAAEIFTAIAYAYEDVLGPPALLESSFVIFDEERQTLSASVHDTFIMLEIGNIQANINGREFTMSSPPVVENGAVMIPIDFIFQAFSPAIDWDGNTIRIFVQ